MKRLLLGISAQAFLIASGTDAWAQATQPQGVETVVVTAQKRQESAQNVGIALTVLSSDTLQKMGIDQINRLEYATPSLEVVPAFGSGQPEFRLRGVGFDDYASNNSSTVGVYVDEVAYPVPAQTQGLLFDLARTEVLYGPQGTLYGVNTTGGAINFVTNRPTDVFTADVSTEYDSHNESITHGYVSGPIVDGLDYRVAAITDQGGAWQTNRETGQSLGSKNTSAVRGELQWQANSDWTFLLEGHLGYDRSQAVGLYLFAPIEAGNPYNLFGLGPTIPAYTKTTQTDWGGSPTFAALTGIPTDARPFRHNDDGGINLQANGDLGFATLTSITSYETLHRREYNDWDATSLALAGTYFDTEARVFSQEVRVASPETDKLSWLLGIYYGHQSMDEIFDSDFAQSLGLVIDTSYQQKVETEAVFGQTEYHFTDKLKLVTGLRYNDESRSEGNFETAGTFLPGAPLIDFNTPANQSIRNRRLSGKGELQYRPSDEVMFYASVSEGVKSGGFTTYNGSASAPPVKPEVLWAYETGFKSNWLQNTLQLNGAAYYYHYEDQQIQSAVWGIAGPVGSLVNAPKSHLYGGELEADWLPIDNLRFAESVGWVAGAFDVFPNFLNIAASTAKCVPASICVPPGTESPVYSNEQGHNVGFPALSYNGSLSYTWEIGGYDLEAAGDWVFHDHLNPLLLGPMYFVKSYWLADLNLTLTPDDGPWALTVFGHNITNTTYDTTRNFFLTGIPIAQRGEPATVGVRIEYKY
ncbi:MAG TPA: TonB-dependent receptor [Rhizomicrobium sp.]|nr:TonB-dependent receptor [Rhizomicrobium sp.]